VSENVIDSVVTKPGEKKIVIILPPATLVGKLPEIRFEWHGFDNPNENMTRMEIASILIGITTSLINQEYQASMPRLQPLSRVN